MKNPQNVNHAKKKVEVPMAVMATMYGLKTYTHKELKKLRVEIEDYVEVETGKWMSIGDYAYLEDILRENFDYDESEED